MNVLEENIQAHLSRQSRLHGWLLRILTLALLICILVSLTGCYAHEINSLAIVMGVGLDEASAPGMHVLTTQIAIPSALKSSGGGSGSSSGGGKGYVMVRNESETILSAVQGITYMVSRLPHFGHNEIIVIGRALAERDITDVVDYFVRDFEGRLTTHIVIADGRAEDLLAEETEIEKLPAIQLRDMLQLQNSTSACKATTLHEFLIATLSKTRAPTLPMVELYKTKEGKTKARIGNTAVLKKGKMVGELDKIQTRGMLWITGEVEGGVLAVDVLGGHINFVLKDSSSSVEPVFKDGKFTIEVKINQTLKANEVVDVEDLMMPESEDAMNAAAQEAILKELTAAVDKAKALNADVFGFGEAIKSKYPGQSEEILKNWDVEFQKLEVHISVMATVSNTGSLTSPIMPGGKP